VEQLPEKGTQVYCRYSNIHFTSCGRLLILWFVWVTCK